MSTRQGPSLSTQGAAIHNSKPMPAEVIQAVAAAAKPPNPLLRQADFLLKFLRDPTRVGALAPATSKLSRQVAMTTMEAYGDPTGHQAGRPLRLIELGAGTGALTRCLHTLNPIVVERDEAWAALLRQQFPALEVRAECAVQTLRDMLEPAGIVCSIPMLNNPQALQLEHMLAQRYAEGLVRFCVLYTYGWTDPLRNAGFRLSARRGFVARNLPPASVWVYR